MQIDINSRKQLNKPENYAAFYSLLNRLPTSDRDALKELSLIHISIGRDMKVISNVTWDSFEKKEVSIRKVVGKL